MADFLETLIEALPFIARITGGYATVTDRDGVRIRTYDSEGQEIVEWRGTVFEMAPAVGQPPTGSENQRIFCSARAARSGSDLARSLPMPRLGHCRWVNM